MSKLKNVSIFGDMLAVAQSFFDAAHPIGEVYVQLPQQDAPEDLYNKNGIVSKWTILSQYDGAFFRSSNAPDAVYKADNEDQYYLYEDSRLIPTDIKSTTSGGPSVATTPSGSPIIIEGVTYKRYPVSNVTRYADNYINKTNVLNKQDSQNKNHSHGGDTSGKELSVSVSGNTGDAGGHTHSVSVTYTNLCDGSHWSGSGQVYIDGGNQQSVTASGGTDERGNHSHSVSATGTISSHSHSIGSDGGNESRPENYTIKIWKRIN